MKNDNVKDIRKSFNVLLGTLFTCIVVFFFALFVCEIMLNNGTLFGWLLVASAALAIFAIFYGIVYSITLKKPSIFFYSLLPLFAIGGMFLILASAFTSSMCSNCASGVDETKFYLGFFGTPLAAIITAIITRTVLIMDAKNAQNVQGVQSVRDNQSVQSAPQAVAPVAVDVSTNVVMGIYKSIYKYTVICNLILIALALLFLISIALRFYMVIIALLVIPAGFAIAIFIYGIVTSYKNSNPGIFFYALLPVITVILSVCVSISSMGLGFLVVPFVATIAIFISSTVKDYVKKKIEKKYHMIIDACL